MQDKRTQVLETALDLFVGQGLQQTSMAQISHDSGVATGTIYHYFTGKDNLIEELYLYCKENFATAIQLNEVELTLSYQSQFELIWRKSYHYYINHKSEFLFKESLSNSPLISKVIHDKASTFLQQGTVFIIQGIESGIFKDVSPVLIMQIIFQSIATLLKIAYNEDVVVDEQMINDAIQICWDGLIRH